MKRADLEKQLGKKIAGRMQNEPHADRYGAASGNVVDRREQRERDKAAGLVPFAVKLPQTLVTQLQGLAAERGSTLSDVTDELLTSALSTTSARAPASEAAPKSTAAPKTAAAAKSATAPRGASAAKPASAKSAGTAKPAAAPRSGTPKTKKAKAAKGG